MAAESFELRLEGATVRHLRPADAPSITRCGNHRGVWANLRDAFPHPYTLESAEWWIGHVMGCDPITDFAIDVDGEAIGGIGFKLGSDVERVAAELGYWIGEPYWGRGIVSQAAAAVARYAIEEHALTRVFAVPFAHNVASHRVLEKAGFSAEGRLRKSAMKEGVVVDQIMYARVRDDVPS